MNTAVCSGLSPFKVMSPYNVCDTQINPSSFYLPFSPKSIPSSCPTLSGAPQLWCHYLFTIMLPLKDAVIILFAQTMVCSCWLGLWFSNRVPRHLRAVTCGVPDIPPSTEVSLATGFIVRGSNAGMGNKSFLWNVRTDTRAHTAPCSTGTGVSSRG
jgi:hypothetical protein